MLGAIGTSTLASTTGVGKSAAGLDAQLAQYEIKLADWVNCPSCNTAQGKAKIAELSGKVSEIKQRIAQAAADKEKAPDLAVSANGVERRGESALTRNNSAVDVPSSTSAQQTGLVGRRLDVFA